MGADAAGRHPAVRRIVRAVLASVLKPSRLSRWMGVFGQTMRCPMQAETSVADALTGDDAVRSPNATAPIPGLVWAFRIHSDGSSEPQAIDRPIALAHDGLLWLHFNLADARALQWLAS